MKNLKTILFLSALSLVACDKNDDLQTTPNNPSDGFTVNSTFYATPNAYIEIDEDDDNGDGFPDSYSFFFLDARMADGDTSTGAPMEASEFIFTANLTNFVFYNLEPADNPALATNPPSPGMTYKGDTYVTGSTGTPNTVIVKNTPTTITSFNPPYFINGVEYGNIVGLESTNPDEQGPGLPTPTLTVNAINIDNVNPAQSTIDVDYVYVNKLGETITGHYEGTVGIILD